MENSKKQTLIKEEIKNLYKTAWEISQKSIMEMAAERGAYICQSQSVNLFFTFPPSTQPQNIHDDYLNYVNGVHWAGAKKLKSLYYLRSNSARNTENVDIKIPKINLDDDACLSCEG